MWPAHSSTATAEMVVDPPRRTVMLCSHCEVTWRSLPDTPCWSCGQLGRTATTAAVVVVE